MRRHLRKVLPNHEAVHGNRWLAPFRSTLLHPRLWHLNRRSAAGGVAAGLFCGLIPGPFQMLGAAITAVVFRVNFPLALLTTFYTNPLTIIPLYLVAFELGQWVLGDRSGKFVAPPEMGDGLSVWLQALGQWVGSLGQPLLVGLPLLATLLAAAGYCALRLAWHIYLVRHWHRRRRQAAP